MLGDASRNDSWLFLRRWRFVRAEVNAASCPKCYCLQKAELVFYICPSVFRTPGWETVICSFCCPVNFPKAQAVKRNNDFLTVPLFLPKPNLLFLLFPSIFSRRRLKKNKAFHDFLFIEKKFRQNNFKCSHSQAGKQTDDFFFLFFPQVFPKHGLAKTNAELFFWIFPSPSRSYTEHQNHLLVATLRVCL